METGKTATPFVLHDPKGHGFDAHAIRFDVEGYGIPAWVEAEGFIFKKVDPAVTGMIAGFPLIAFPCRCNYTVTKVMNFQTNYCAMQNFCMTGFSSGDKWGGACS